MAAPYGAPLARGKKGACPARETEGAPLARGTGGAPLARGAGGAPLARRKALALALAATLLPAAAPAPLRLLILGDSLTAGYGLPHAEAFQAQLAAALRQAGRNVTLIDGAVSGDTTAGGLARLDWVLADGADAALVELGGNDGLRAIAPADTRANLTAILDRLAARKIPVLLSGMYAPPNLGKEYETAFRAVFDELGHRPGVIYDPFFLAGVAGDPALNQADGIHPNAAGVRRIVARLLPLVLRLLDAAAAAKEAS